MVRRTAATVGGAYWADTGVQRGAKGLDVGLPLAVVLMLNPIPSVRMQRSRWQPIDLWFGLSLLGWSCYWALRKPRSL